MTTTSRNDLFDRVGSIRGVALVRLAFGPIVVFHLWGFWRDALDGYTYQDRFHEPFWEFLPHLPESLYVVVLTLGIVSGVAMAIGLASRVATTTAFMVVGYNLLVDQTSFQHNRAFLLMNLGLLSLQPVGHALSFDAWWFRHRNGAALDDQGLLWPLYLQRILISSVYLSSGISKALDPDWASGLVLWDRVTRYRHEFDHVVFGDTIEAVLTTRGVHTVFAPIVLATEVLIGLGLWHRRTRLVAVWIAIVFHTSIEITANVHTFSYAALAALAVWAVPSTRDRTVVVSGRASAVAVRAFDWLGRFEVRVDPDRDWLLVERDGTHSHGRAARINTLLRLPLAFFFVAPAAVVMARRRRGVSEPQVFGSSRIAPGNPGDSPSLRGELDVSDARHLDR